MFGFLALPIERYKYAVLLPLLYFPFFSSLRNVLSTALYLGFANLVHGYHCLRSIVTNVLFPPRTLIASQLRHCRRAIVAPLGLPKYRRPFVTVERAREMAKIFENATIPEPEKVHRSPAGYCTISSRPNCRRGTN